MVDSAPFKGFGGLTVAAFESRLAKEMTSLIIRHGGKPLVAPTMKEVPLEDNAQVLGFGERLLAGDVEIVIFLTGVGARSMVAVWGTRWQLTPMIKALGRTILVARGPKSVNALKEMGLVPTVIVPEPNTWEDVIRSIDHFRPDGLKGLRVAVQEYGVANPELLEALKTRGAEVYPVPVYRWAMPDDLVPVRNVLKAIQEKKVPILLFTNAAQIDHIFHVLDQEGGIEGFRRALAQAMVASIGQITSDRLRHYGITVDLEPSHPKMGILVKESSHRAEEILRKKQEIPSSRP